MTKSALQSRHPWTTSMVWGWRLELQLGAATAALQLLSLDISPVGPLLVLVAQVAILIKRPDLRVRFETTASRQHEVAKLHYACLLSGLGNSRGDGHTVGDHLWNGGGNARKTCGLFSIIGHFPGRQPGAHRTHHSADSQPTVSPTTNSFGLDGGHTNSNFGWSHGYRNLGNYLFNFRERRPLRRTAIANSKIPVPCKK